MVVALIKVLQDQDIAKKSLMGPEVGFSGYRPALGRDSGDPERRWCGSLALVADG